MKSFGLGENLDFFGIENTSRPRKYDKTNENSRFPKRVYKFMDGAKNKISNLFKYY